MVSARFIEFSYAYYNNQTENNENNNFNNQENFYLNLDILNLNNQNVLFNINELKSNLSQKDKTISLKLGYNPKSSYDIDNDGLENLMGVIDFSINSGFNWNVDKGKLCTRWEIYSIDYDRLTTICYGNDNCCKFIDLAPSRSNWSDILYLTYGMHGASENNIISTQVIYVDYDLSTEKPYSDVYYSKWSSLSAIFKDGNSIKNTSIEKALRNIEKIRNNNNQIKKIDLKDENGNELKEFSGDENISMIFNISKTNSNIAINSLSASKKGEEIIVSLNNFNPLSAEWNNSNSIDIRTESNGLSEFLKEIGVSPKAIVSIKGVDNFLRKESYDGYIRLSLTEPFNSVIYCPDDAISTCRIVKECLNEFKGIECYVKNTTILTVYVPHFSSIIVGFDNKTANLTINSPDNSSALLNGENIYLKFTINETINANYSLNGQNIVNLGNGTSFSTLLDGTLPYGVLINAQHNLSINVRDASGNNAIVNYSFAVNDTLAPSISINITNNSIFSGTSLLLLVNINSNEHSDITYKINENSFPSTIDLGAGKSKIINLTIINGANKLTINASDLHYNSNLNYLSFNFSLAQAPSCSDAIQNGDETGIDCGGSCSSCIAFNIFTNKSSYNLTDNVYLTVIARANSTVNATVLKQNVVTYRRTFVPVFTGAPIAEKIIIDNTTNAGNYTINATMYYLNISENKNATFEIAAPSSNPISVTINANATTVNEGDAIIFTSAISGNSSAISYKWDFQNDGVIDSTSASTAYTYTTNGTYNVNLTVSDSMWNQTDIEIITVRKLYNVTILAKDNATTNIIENVEVEFDDELKNTSSDGKADFIRIAGRYSLAVKKPSYASFSNKTEINGNAIIEVYLIEDDVIAPIIQFMGPEDKSTISNNPTTFKYKATDKSDMTCKLYININSSLWKVEAIDINVKSDTESSFTLNDLKNSTYQWQIECIDREGNSNFSEIRTFTVDTSLTENELSIDLNEQDKDAEDIISQIDFITANLDSLSMDEKEATEAMQLRKNLEKSKIAVQRANRDLHSLIWRRLNQSELEQETKRILSRIEEVKVTTPKKIEVVDKSEFVKYASKEDVNKALEVLINSTNLKFSKKEFNNLVQENYKLQSLITVTTKAKIIDVDYISGTKNTITLIQKVVNTDKTLDSIIFFEVIPKDIAKDLSEITLLFDYEIISNDPIVSIDVNKIKEFSYILNKRTSISDTEKLKSILLNKNLKSSDKSSNLITGFLPLNKISSDFVKTADLRLIVEFAIVIILLIIFSYYQFGGSDKIAHLFNKELNEINGLVSSALNDLKNNDYGNATLKYKEINSMFNKLDKGKRDRLKESVVELINKINLLYINQLSEKVTACIITNNREDAHAIYLKIQSIYKIIPKNYKAEVSKKCLEIHNKLSIK